MTKFPSNLTKVTPNDLLFWEVGTAKGPFFDSTLNNPLFFLQNPTPNAPCIRSLVGTYLSLSYPCAPGGHMHMYYVHK